MVYAGPRTCFCKENSPGEGTMHKLGQGCSFEDILDLPKK